jgi:hypothetical protein
MAGGGMRDWRKERIRKGLKCKIIFEDQEYKLSPELPFLKREFTKSEKDRIKTISKQFPYSEDEVSYAYSEIGDFDITVLCLEMNLSMGIELSASISAMKDDIGERYHPMIKHESPEPLFRLRKQSHQSMMNLKDSFQSEEKKIRHIIKLKRSHGSK